MTKYVVDAKVVGQRMLNAVTKQIDLIAPQIAAEAVPGQFVNVQVSRRTAPLLRRPLGVAGVDREHGVITLIYRIIGEATKILADVCSGDVISVVGPLGHGFDRSAKHPLLIGGGTGLAPLLYLAETMAAEGIKPDVIMGGRTAEDLFWKDMYLDLVERMGLTTDDGSLGTKGTVMAELPLVLQRIHYDCVYVCGPAPMMKAVSAAVLEKGIKCQVSLEKYMACGLGACLSCSCQGIGKRIKVCQDGPVFWAEEVAEW
ncbi:MAG: dihydroorotate dehydrogenase electron transfer subunit [Acidaminococcaceae bacterium]|jgi:dihydroorotate dehydrogenase electron transfer subunit|uniref:dihydroorotate dehydrogenase electron transfer subunit n=1 Tax=Succiniclasticum sp. TaxID=2775030 RepID=UPI000E8E2A72|nr:dihydroorotate dehydrogenase electron transfer subunit [Succiniclasticum sp.]MBP3811601.1 dihydroorotate dehydrogenase electron transfer subunit [Acidaminococcaceae bacterium]MDY6290306.1 dihydroorotate dehydrogenase electron transfer subunit [Succiniclasticum sp.]HAT98433.1 dihydroorotate dehydrogenase electron transfer subunit [Acidaminococcaceae bacterium]